MSESLELVNIRLNDQNKFLHTQNTALRGQLEKSKRALVACRDFVNRVKEAYNPRVGSYVLPLIETAMADMEVTGV